MLIKEKIIKKEEFVEPKEASNQDILLGHTKEYLEKIKKGKLSEKEIAILEIPYSKELVKFAFLNVGGTILAGKLALKNRVGIHIGGGFHHAFPDHGEGFCVFNDIAVCVKKLQKEKLIKKVLVIDCDLHQGNGTAFIFKDDKSVFTFSIHQEVLYPMTKPPSNIDIGLDVGASNKEYLMYLENNLPLIIKKFKPDFILYVAGADPYKEDQLGGLKLTLSGLKQRDEFVIGLAAGSKIPVCIVLAGGYAKKTTDTVKIHTNTIKVGLKYMIVTNKVVN